MPKRDHLPLVGCTSDGMGVTVHESEIGALTQLAGWGSFASTAASAMSAESLPFPADYRCPARNEAGTAWRIAPDRLLVASGKPLALSNSDELVVLDLSDARVLLTVAGVGAAGLLSRAIPLDFSAEGFPVGTFAQSSMHHVGVLVDRREKDEFLVLVPTTWARSLIGFLADHIAGA